MSTDREVTRIVRSWLEEGPTTLPDRVLDGVLDQLPSTQQRRPWWPAWRFGTMTIPIRIAGAAAAVAVAAIVGINLLPGQGVGPGSTATPSPTAPPSPTPAPTVAPTPIVTPLLNPTALPDSGSLAPGTYIVGDPFQLQVSMDVPAGWRVWGGVSSDGAGIYKDSPDPPAGKAIVITAVEAVYVDACDSNKGVIDPGPTANDLATALANQAQTQASAISDVTVAGYSGKYVEYSFEGPTSGCVSLNRWPMGVGPRQAIADEHDKVWILDVDGVLLVIDVAYFSGASAADHAEMLAMVNSIEITP
jgi:hypothetical protein